jgi:hypothetical protein
MNMTTKTKSKLFPLGSEEEESTMMHAMDFNKWMIVGIVIVVIIFIVVLYRTSSEKKNSTPSSSAISALDHPGSVQRFRALRQMWEMASKDTTFLLLTKTLMNINSSAMNSKDGNKDIHMAYKNLDNYVKHKMKLRGGRMTLIYVDGIVFYDSALNLSRTYFMQNGLPRPVSIYTLGSPLKDHNTLPENFNSLMVHPQKMENMMVMGMPVTDALYKELFSQGYGFIERMSSSLAIPCTYLSRFLTFNIDPITSFPDGCTLSVSMPIGLM